MDAGKCFGGSMKFLYGERQIKKGEKKYIDSVSFTGEESKEERHKMLGP